MRRCGSKVWYLVTSIKKRPAIKSPFKAMFLFSADVSVRDASEKVEATVKYDGTLGIAFAWNGEVMVTTKRRMDSEQAIWAKQWIKDHCDLTSFQAGYTYLFEIIYQNNTVIVNYLFEGLVLLAITDESGFELPYEDVLNCARNMGFFMVTPRITAPYSEILWYCGGIDHTTEESKTPNRPAFISGALPVNKRQEGWVVKFNDGGRQKFLYSWRKKVSKNARLVHPQIVWLLVKHNKSREILSKVPSHFRDEIRRMMQAIGRKFKDTVRRMEEHLTVSYAKSHVSRKLCSYYRTPWGYFSDHSSISTDSECDTDSETLLCEQNEQLRLDKDDVTTIDTTTSEYETEFIKKTDTSIAYVFFPFARKHLTLSSSVAKVRGQLEYEIYGKWCLNRYSPPVKDESTESENDTGEEKLPAETEKLRLDDITSETTTSKDKTDHIKISDTNKASDFVRLTRKFKPYWKVVKNPKARHKYSRKEISPIYNPHFDHESYHLRLPVLDYICPLSPELDGYQPSDNFKQTWCKAWKFLPVNDIQFIQEVFQENHSTPHFLQLPVEVIVFLLEFLDGESVVMMTRVCVRLRHIISSSKALTKIIALAKEEHSKLLESYCNESYTSERYYSYSYSQRNWWDSCDSY